MLAVFDQKVAKSPEELRAPAAEGRDGSDRLMDHFAAAWDGAVVVSFGLAGGMAYTLEKQNPLLPPRDRGPFPASQVVRDLGGNFAFVLFDRSSNSTFIAADANGSVPFFWGADSEDHLVLSDDVDIVKKGCGKSFAPFPKGCFYTTSGGLQSFEHPLNG
ncbi:stem-specific protein TSJT1-like [Canna indica]|uniref:Stem-specific protein TSJT1-like n=1 Tax=Canna indica TaxID=4628 RepID=A0AAQ3PW88_9LILI|nr:stem-specific protein TSJT1-like [Canna indica]